MGLANYTLCGGQKDKGLIDTEVLLYEKLEDVQNTGYEIYGDGKTMYAKYGELTDPKASLILVKINGVDKALLTTAIRIEEYLDNFKDIRQLKAEGSGTLKDGCYLLKGGCPDGETTFKDRLTCYFPTVSVSSCISMKIEFDARRIRTNAGVNLYFGIKTGYEFNLNFSDVPENTWKHFSFPYEPQGLGENFVMNAIRDSGRGYAEYEVDNVKLTYEFN